MFKVNLETTFDDILRKCIEIWSNNSNFSLYDDSFNNLDCCGSCQINDFFVNYQPSDNTLKQGEVVFYMIDKLVNQRNLLESQEKAIDSKSEAVEENDDRGQNLAHQELESCISMIKDGKILKGINNYKLEKIDEKKNFKKIIQMADNRIFYIILFLIFIILSIASFSLKKNIPYFSSANWENKNIFENIDYPDSINSMNDYLTVFRKYIEQLEIYKTSQASSFYVIGPVRLRFMMTYGYDCLGDYKNIADFKLLTDALSITCISNRHEGIYIYKDKGVYTYKYTSATNIERILETPLGYYDTSGILIDIDLDKTTDYNNKIRDIKFIEESPPDQNSENYLDQNLKAIEFTFTTYNPNLDVFVTNLMVSNIIIK